MASQQSPEEYLTKRLDDISTLIYEVASGNFDYKLERQNSDEVLEGLIGGISMLGEELKASTVSRDFMESIYGGVADILMILRNDLTIDRVNDAVSRYLGFTADELGGRAFSTLVNSGDQDLINDVLSHIKENGFQHNVEMRLTKKDGTYLETSASFSSLYDNQKNHLGTILIAKDITVLKESEKKLKESKEKAEALNRAKSDFLANMSHEIRTPLNGMLGFIELLGETEPSTIQKEYLGHIKNSGHVLSKLLNDILDINKVESGKLILEVIPFNPQEYFLSNFYPYKYLAQERGLDFDITFNKDIPDTVLGDPSRISQVIRNLVSNSLKFTQTGKIELSITVEDKPKAEVELICRVIDTGMGIDADSKDSIYESFTQADSSTTRKFGGSGLGLSITRRLVLLMNGTIHFESPPSSLGGTQGTMFEFSVPLKKAEEKSTKLPATEEIDPLTLVFDKSYNILVVDDNEINLILAKKILSRMNLNITVARNGKEGIEKATEGNIDLILMDIQMPVMDGMQASTKLRELGFKNTILALSANVFSENIKKCLESGMDGHIQKPYSITTIYNAMKSHLVK